MKQLRQRVVGIARDVVETWRKLNTNRMPTLLVGITVDHARGLGAAFQTAAISAEADDGDTSTAERGRILAAFLGGRPAVLCACAVVDEGLVAPEAGSPQLVRPTRSLRLLRQLEGG